MTEFTFFWRDGKREVLPGDTPEEAASNAGYGAGAIRALDFYASGNNTEYTFDKATREWRNKKYFSRKP